MNKIFYLIMSILFVFWLCMGFYIFTSIAKGDHLEQEIPTQKNKQTDLFDKSVDNLSDFTGKLEAGKQGGIDSMGGEHGNPQGLQYITKKSKGELGGESGKLESIGENDLASRGREEMIKKDSLNELYTDYSRPLNKQHLKDAKTIANAQDELLKNLLEKLKDLGVDCKTIKGDKKIEPEYFLQTKTSNHKDTLYNQTFCEEPRGEYRCTNGLTLHCSDSSYVAGSISNVSGNMAHTINKDGVMSVGVNQINHFYNDWGSIQNYDFVFDVDEPKGVETFKLINISWADHVMATLNNHIIFKSSGVIDKIEMSYEERNYRRNRQDGERYFGVDLGTGNYVCCNTKQYFDASPHFEAKQYLKKGRNTLMIRMAYGRGGKLWTQFQFREKACKQWKENWIERCYIK
jgi:hypothetical protein